MTKCLMTLRALAERLLTTIDDAFAPVGISSFLDCVAFRLFRDNQSRLRPSRQDESVSKAGERLSISLLSRMVAGWSDTATTMTQVGALVFAGSANEESVDGA
jgi:hypothetical protein